MPKFKIKYTQTINMECEVKANTKEEAIEIIKENDKKKVLFEKVVSLINIVEEVNKIEQACLVLDEMLTNCYYCKIGIYASCNTKCPIAKKIDYNSFDSKTRPNWCPLKTTI